MSRLFSACVLLLVTGLLTAGFMVTAASLEELKGEPVKVWAVQRETDRIDIKFLGTECSVSLEDYGEKLRPGLANLGTSLERALTLVREHTRQFSLPNIHLPKHQDILGHLN